MMLSGNTLIHKCSNRQLEKILDRLTRENILQYDENRANMITIIMNEKMERKRLTKDRLDGLTNFDQSNHHLSKSELIKKIRIEKSSE